MTLSRIEEIRQVAAEWEFDNGRGAGMTKQELLNRMTALRACDDANEWVQSQDGTAQSIWGSCERGDWMLWYAAMTKQDARLIGRAAALCAQEALRFVPAGEDRPRKCIDTVLAWSRGEATIDDVRRARESAYAAYAAAASADAAYAAYAADAAASAAAADAYAADAAAYAAAADAADAAASAAAADAYAADAAAYAADAAAYAAAAYAAYADASAFAARNASLKRSAEIVRSVFVEVPR